MEALAACISFGLRPITDTIVHKATRHMMTVQSSPLANTLSVAYTSHTWYLVRTDLSISAYLLEIANSYYPWPWSRLLFTGNSTATQREIEIRPILTHYWSRMISPLVDNSIGSMYWGNMTQTCVRNDPMLLLQYWTKSIFPFKA